MPPARSLFLCLLLLAPFAAARPTSALFERAHATLRQVAAEEEGWIKVHAADAYLALGEPARARAVFSDEETANLDRLPYRIGLMRTFAQATPAAGERTHWLRRIEAVATDPTAPDRLQALETVGKLGYAMSGDARLATKAFVASRSPADATLAYWALAHAEDPAAIPALVQALASTDATARLRAAYALRWLRPRDRTTRQTLATAAGREPSDSPAYAYVLAAALALNPEHVEASRWQAQLEAVLRSGAPNARYEAAQVLMRRYRDDQLDQLSPLFAHPHGDVRLAAAWTILHVLRK